MKIHVVQKGDTLWDISEQYNVSYEELLQMNAHISSPDMIMPGMKIRVPTTSKAIKTEHVKEKNSNSTKPEHMKVDDTDSTSKHPYQSVPQQPMPVIEEDDDITPKHVKAETPWQTQMTKPSLDMPEMQMLKNYPEYVYDEKSDDSKCDADKDMLSYHMQDAHAMECQPMNQYSQDMQTHVCMCCGQPLHHMQSQCMDHSQSCMTQMPLPCMPVQNMEGCAPQGSKDMTGMSDWSGHQMTLPGSKAIPYSNAQQNASSGYGQMPAQGGSPMMGGQMPAQGGSPMMGGQMPAQGGSPMMGGQMPAQGGSPMMGGQMPAQGGSPMMGGQMPAQDHPPMMRGQIPVQDNPHMMGAQLPAQQMMMHTAYPYPVNQSNMPNAPYPVPPYQQKRQEQTDENNSESNDRD